MTYEILREIRLGYAEGELSYNSPVYPYPGRARNIGRVVIAGPEAGFYPLDHRDYSRLNREAFQRQKAQTQSLPK